MPKKKKIETAPKKSELDKFYTNPEVAKECISLLTLTDYDQVIEPSAGNGSFSKNINHNNLMALDLEPEDSSIIKMNWMDYKEDNVFKKVLIIGNPPFGIRNNLSKEFIEHAIKMINVKTIAFILPNVFNKYTNQKIFPRDWILREIYELKKDSFLLNNEPYHVPCSFYIWDKVKDLRFRPEDYSTCSDFKFCDKKEDAHWFIMGAAPNTVKEIDKVEKNNRGYYIRATKISKKTLKENFEKIKWNGNSSVNGGAFWMTKPEIIKEYINGTKNNISN